MKYAIITCLILCLFQACVFAADDAQAPSTLSPSITQVSGTTEARLGPGLYPQFINFIDSTDAKCEAYLKEDYSKGGFSLAPICTKSKYGNGYVGGKCSDFLPIDQLVIKDFKIPDAYRKTAKMLITWTVRIEGYSKKYSVNPELCRNWYGKVTEKFPGEHIVKTALYVNGNKTGAEVSIAIPEIASETITERAPSSDPTLVGTYVLTAEDFPDKQFPAKIGLIEIRWLNETPMRIVSPGGMRNLMVNMLPVTKTSQQ